MCTLALAGCGDGEHEAARASDFVDSVGVNVHMSYMDTPYRDVAAVRDALRDLRVHHVRDGLRPDMEDQYRSLSALAAEGVAVNLILGDPQGRFGTAEQLVETLKTRLPGVAASVEGPNEYDGSGDPAWPEALHAYQKHLYETVKDDPTLSQLPVLGPSLIDNSAWSRVGDLSDALEYGNLHPYPGGEPLRPADLERQLDLVRSGSGSDPVIVTETGYHNAVNAPVPPAQPAVSEQAAAIYVPRLLLEHFRVGIERTFLYELIDEHHEPSLTDQEQHFGLVRHDLSRKPAFTAVRNLLSLLEDPGPSFAPGSLEFSLKAGQPVQQLLLQKRDGRFYLAVWRSDAAAWSKAAKVDLEAPPAAVSVRFGRPADWVRVHSPVESPRAVGTHQGVDTLQLELGAEPLVLEIEEG
jgi:hypothetical protein